MKKKLTVAIDGPAGAGKSTVARILAERLNYIYIDTGAMYRAVTFKVIKMGLSEKDRQGIIEIAKAITIRLNSQDGLTRVVMDGDDISEAIRTPEVSRLVSTVARIPEVRREMVRLQREMAAEGGVVMDGRDIGTFVLPDADVKVFLTASIEERAQRRLRELKEKGFVVSYEELKDEIACRDRMDCERDVAPLVKADDAMLIDTTMLTIEEAVKVILDICRERV